MWIGIAAVFLGGAFVAEVGRRARAGQLSRNHLVGIRTTATLTDDETWERVHSAAGSWLVAAGVVATSGSIGAAVLAITGASEGTVAALLLGGVVGMVVLVIVAGRVGARAAALDPPS